MGWLSGSGFESASVISGAAWGALGSVSGILASFWKARWYMALSLALAAAASFLYRSFSALTSLLLGSTCRIAIMS